MALVVINTPLSDFVKQYTLYPVYGTRPEMVTSPTRSTVYDANPWNKTSVIDGRLAESFLKAPQYKNASLFSTSTLAVILVLGLDNDWLKFITLILDPG
jgi:hypothetical protein